VDEQGGKLYRLDDEWRFIRGDTDGAQSTTLNDSGWDRVMLPHTARIESLLTGEPDSATRQWQGICWYRRRLRLNRDAVWKKVFLKFDGAMNVADVWLDGAKVGHHLGGYLPFVLDVTDHVKPGSDAVLAVRLDNTDNPVTGPKPLNLLDFNTYHGLYRYVHLIVKDRLHITDPILANRPAGGGVFVTYPKVTSEAATVRLQTHVRNDHSTARRCHVRATLADAHGNRVSSTSSGSITLQGGADSDVVQEMRVEAPRLWSPLAPNLYTMRVEVVSAGRVVDVEHMRIGIRRIEISRDGFMINGDRMFLRGTNQHQEYPYVGYAVPEAAQYRDARKIKEAGFDYVRLSHYPHAPAFMDACDELGIVVMNSIPGWQYFGKDPAFTELQYQNCRDMIRRDRNRPSVIMWEVSLNETEMPAEFIAKTHAIAHEEYPGDQCYTCGWTHGYDVFIQARQHGGCTKEDDHQCVVSEYGDWEYYAMTAGLNQESWERLSPAESNSRQLRWQGERAMLQQASNFQEAHNDNRATRAFADGLWVMYDYNRGYAPDIESSGCMDIFRLPKYSYWFFRSQRSPGEQIASAVSGPNVFIANEWTPASSTDVRIFSNCEEVELRLNGEVIERRRPDQNRMTGYLAHPPFTFHVQRFVPGKLEAIAFIGGHAVTRHAVLTPGAVEQLALSVDLSGVPLSRHRKDVLFCRASLKDANGMVVMDAFENVAFGATPGATLIGANPFSTDAGIASILVQTESSVPAHSVFALSIVRSGTAARILAASRAVTGYTPGYEVRFTVDGSKPGPSSTLYTRPIESSAPVRAVLVSRGSIVAALDETAKRTRIRANIPPESRDKFR
jgi:beta-galactosidase